MYAATMYIKNTKWAIMVLALSVGNINCNLNSYDYKVKFPLTEISGSNTPV